MVFPYIKKYSRLNLRLARYNLGKWFKYDPLQGARQKLLKDLGRISPAEIKELLNKRAVNSLLSPDLATAIEVLRRDARFMEQLTETGRNACDRKFLILGQLCTNTYDEQTGHYHWHRDLFVGYDYVLSHYSQVRKKNKVPGVDIKNVWELSRMQYLFAPALLWRITGEERYAEFVCSVIRDWIVCNSCEEGPNWNIAMEVGIRITNIMLAYQLVRNSQAADDDFCLLVLASAFQHMQFILGNEENVGGRTSNHYLGGLLGLLSVVSTFPFLPDSPKVSRYVTDAFEHEIRKQILIDGGGFEGSTSYQRLVGEMFALAGVICKYAGLSLSEGYKTRLLAAANFTLKITKPDGRIPQIGDNDGGRIFVLRDNDNLNHYEFINLVYWVVTGQPYNCEFAAELMCFTGVSAPPAESGTRSRVTIFPDSRLAVYNSPELYSILNAVDAHRFDMGGHTHNDKLSFELMVDGKNFIVDPGTGVYTPRPTIRNKLRSVTSHSTLQVNRHEQNQVDEKVLFGMRYDCKTQIYCEKHEPDWVELIGKVTAYKKDAEYEHIRRLVIDRNNQFIKIVDKVSGFIERLDWFFVLHPEVHASITGKVAWLTNGNVTIKLHAPLELHITDGYYSNAYGNWENSHILTAGLTGNLAASKEINFRIDWN